MPKHDIEDEAGSEGDDYVSDNVASDGEAEAAKPTKQKKKRAKQEKAPKDPNAPKRPQSTYFLFLAEKRAQFKLDNPDAKSKEIVSQIAAMWNAPGLDKTPYEEQYKTDKAAYEIVKAEYEAKHGKPVSAKASKQKKGPKRPPSAYLIFSGENRERIANSLKEEALKEEDVTFGDIGRAVGAAWKDLDDAARAPYNAKQVAAKAQHAVTLKAWTAANPE